jgi:ketosteroid isomerase-like protein
VGAGADCNAKDTVRDFIARLNSGADPWALLSNAAVVTINGTTPLSGRYPGIDLIRGILVDTARVVIASLTVSINEMIGSGARIAALLNISGRTMAGAAFNDEGCLCGCVFSVNDGVIDEVVLFPDTSLIEIALYRRRFVPDA